MVFSKCDSSLVKFLIMILLLLQVACSPKVQFTQVQYVGFNETPHEEYMGEEAKQILEQIKTETAKLQNECKTLVCEARTRAEFQEADNVCDKSIDRPTYTALTVPPQYLVAKTLILFGLNQTEMAFNFSEERKERNIKTRGYNDYFECWEHMEIEQCMEHLLCDNDSS